LERQKSEDCVLGKSVIVFLKKHRLPSNQFYLSTGTVPKVICV